MTENTIGSDLLAFAGVPLTGIAPPTTFTIGYPTTAPQNCNWVKVANSSPYTIYVSQGQLLGQVEAFTADVFPVRSGQPLNVQPVATAGQVAAGSDLTVYTTWYLQQPPGSYPSALGSSGTALQVSDSFFNDNSGSAINSGTSRLYGPVNATGFASTRLALAEVSGTGPLIFTLGWIYPTGRIANRRIVLPPGGVVDLITPNLTDEFQLTVANQTALNTPAPEVEAVGQVQAVGTFTDDQARDGVISQGQALNVGNGGTAQRSDFGPFPGPANFNVTSTAFSGGLGWSAVLTADLAGDHTYSAQVCGLFSPGSGGVPFFNEPIMLPSAPLKLVLSNGLGAGINTSFTWNITADAWRVG